MDMTFGTCFLEGDDSKMGEMSPQARGLLRVAGFLVWFLAGLPLFVQVVQVPELLHQTRYICWLSCYFAFGATFGLTRWDTGSRGTRRLQLGLLAIQAATALAMIVLVCSGHEGALLVLVAAQLGWFMSLRHALLWVATQAVLMGIVLTFGGRSTLSLMFTYVAFQVLAPFSCFLPAREANAAPPLSPTN